MRPASRRQPEAKPQRPAAHSEPAGEGFAIQVAALERATRGRRHRAPPAGKGYSAYVVAPTRAPGVFRVRVGKFKERREAESVSARLQKEEQFKPWIVVSASPR